MTRLIDADALLAAQTHAGGKGCRAMGKTLNPKMPPVTITSKKE